MPAFHRLAFGPARSCFVVIAMCVTACLPSRDLREYSSSGPDASDESTLALEPAPESSPQAPDMIVVPSDEAEVDVPLPLDDAAGMSEPREASTEPNPGVTPPLVDADPVSACALDETLGPDGHCYFFDARTLAWDTARSACQARGPGWDLGSVLTAAESRFLGDTATIEAWIGASDAVSEGVWTWVVDAQPFWSGGVDGTAAPDAYVNWNATEPNGGATTNCARILPRSFGSMNPDAPWADLACGELRGAVCEAYPIAPRGGDD
jgi:hypothetical protein